MNTKQLISFFGILAFFIAAGCQKSINKVENGDEDPLKVPSSTPTDNKLLLLKQQSDEPPIASSVASEIEFPKCRFYSHGRGVDTYVTSYACRLSPEFVQNLIARGADVNQYNEYGQTPLMLVDDVESVNKLVEAGADVNHADDYGRTALDYADSADIVHAIMKTGKVRDISVNPPNLDSMDCNTFLALIEYGFTKDYGEFVQKLETDSLMPNGCINKAVAEYLIKYRLIDSSDKSCEYKSDLIDNAMIRIPDNAFIQSLLDRWPDCEVSRGLYYLVKNNNTSLLTYVLEHRTIPNSEVTDLLREAKTLDMIRLLANAGADIDTMYANTENDDLAALLKQAGAKVPNNISLARIKNLTCMKDAVRIPKAKNELKDGQLLFDLDNGRYELFEFLVSSGANIHAKDEEGRSLLHRYDSYDKITKLLLNKGLKPNVTDKNKQTPLFDADAGIKELLIKAGADVNAVNAAGESVVSYVYKHREDGSRFFELKILADHNADDLKPGSDFLRKHGFKDANEILQSLPRCAEDPFGDCKDAGESFDGYDEEIDNYINECLNNLGNAYPPSFYYKDYNCAITQSDGDDATGIRYRDDRVIRAWLAQGSDPNQRDENGQTPLFHVLFPKEARILLAAGADVNARDNAGNTPLLNLLRGSDCECRDRMIAVLLNAGADISAVNHAGQSVKDLLEKYCQDTDACEGYIQTSSKQATSENEEHGT